MNKESNLNENVFVRPFAPPSLNRILTTRHSTPFMVLDESSVLPAKAALDSAKNEGDECFESPVTRPSCPFKDPDWTDKDHYYDGDLANESCSIEEWKRTYRDLD